MTPQAAAFLKILRHPVRFRMFLFSKLPSAFFSGLRIREASETRCVVSVPFKWFTKNPFRSTYFACLSMAAEMSTGAMAMMHVYGQNPPVSMLVLKSEAQYTKKAKGVTFFSCEDGLKIAEAVALAIHNGEAQTISVKSVGTDASGQMVADFRFTWSFRQKK